MIERVHTAKLERVTFRRSPSQTIRAAATRRRVMLRLTLTWRIPFPTMSDVAVRGAWGAICAGALVVALFCLPLFVGLRASDLRNDEAIYSYAVDRMLETGDWLTPRALPLDHAFLEKPPLKFWLVAAPIRSGLLPHDELGLRFIDPLLGTFAFLYVLAIGWRLAGPLCGIVAVFVLFMFEPLLFEHGLRSNNMESALVLAYAAGVYHLGRWLSRAGTSTGRLHTAAAAVAFVLAFMTKFVAAFFLPVIGILAVLWQRRYESGVARSWRDWAWPAALAALLIVPWFAYQFALHGRLLFDVMVGQHVVERFTDALDPSHLQPWHYYVSRTWTELTAAGTAWPVAIGVVLLVFDSVRLRNGSWQRLLLLWLVVPLVLMSFGTSKILHYAYPLLPPVALGAGYAVALTARASARVLQDLLTRAHDWIRSLTGRRPRDARREPGTAAWLWTGAGAIAAIAVGIGVGTLLAGDLRFAITDGIVVTNSSVLRPLVVAGVLLLLIGRPRLAGGVVALILLAALLPVGRYDSLLTTAQRVDHPLRTLRDCVTSVRADAPGLPRGVYNAAATTAHHSYNYYLRDIGPVTLTDVPDRSALRQHLADTSEQMPVVLTTPGYDAYAEAGRQARRSLDASRPMSARDSDAWLAQPHTGVAPDDAAVILMPPLYAHCAGRAATAGGQLVGDVPPAGPVAEPAF